jgi:SAM-dependent methyltransferase
VRPEARADRRRRNARPRLSPKRCNSSPARGCWTSVAVKAGTAWRWPAGYDVTGLELSPYHIELAGRAAADAGVALTLINDDMRRLPVEPPFDAVINIFSSFGYLESDDEDATVIARVAQALNPGGRFLIDFNNSVRVLRQFQPSPVTRLDDGTLLVEERRYDALAGRSDSTWTHVSPSGERHAGAIRMYTPAELRRMIEAAGMRGIASYGDFDGSALTMDSRRAILVGEK